MDTHRLRIARQEMSKRFLDEIVGNIEDGKIITADQVIIFHKAFIDRVGSVMGVDFDLAHTWQLAERRSAKNKWLLQNASENLPSDAVDVEIALAFLEELVFGIKSVQR